MMKKLLFTDCEGFEYIYNDDAGIIVPTLGKDKFSQLNKIYLDIYKKQEEKVDDFIMQFVKENEKGATIKFDKNHYTKYGIKQLTFKLTDQCNLRCKYCTYSENYQETLTYSDDKLKFDVAKKAVDVFMNYYGKHVESMKDDPPYFTFYGGEPMLNFKLIQEIVEYTNENYGQFTPKYLMTTNGLLFNDKNSQFLKNNNFFVSISIDGYKENHDRNRVTPSGGKTFDKVTSTAKKYFSDYKYWNIFMVYDTLTDLEKLIGDKNNFGEFEDIFFERVSKIGSVSNINTNYYDRFTKEEFQSFRSKAKKIRQNYLDGIVNHEETDVISKLLFEFELILLHDRQKYRKPLGYYTVPLGSCVPGEKLFLQTDGTFTLCEKVPSYDSLIIGDVEDGLQETKIREIIEKMNSLLSEKCLDCKVSGLCSLCYSAIVEDEKGNFKFNENACDQVQQSAERLLSDYVYIAKYNSKMFDEFLMKKYTEV